MIFGHISRAFRPKIILGGGLLALFWSCAFRDRSASQNRPITVNLDSLNSVVERKDSVESNLIFYEEAYLEYRKIYPGVDRPEFMKFAKGKDQEFCLFQPKPAETCLLNGDKFNDLSLKAPAMDAYQAGLVSEGSNDPSINLKLWASVGQLYIEEKDAFQAKLYLDKILEVDPKNKWAKASLLKLTNN